MRAERYMMEYADEVGDDDMETALTDMLADIMHFAEQYVTDFDHILDVARRHYEAEKENEHADG